VQLTVNRYTVICSRVVVHILQMHIDDVFDNILHDSVDCT